MKYLPNHRIPSSILDVLPIILCRQLQAVDTRNTILHLQRYYIIVGQKKYEYFEKNVNKLCTLIGNI